MQNINKHYNSKSDTGTVIYPSGATLSISFKYYQRDVSDCKKAVKLFFDQYKQYSVLPKKDNYVAVDAISNPLLDNTIAFLFKEGEETLDGNEIAYKGFQHAERYVKDVNSWVSYVWTSKLGLDILITHGYPLCYLVPENGSANTAYHQTEDL